MQSSRENTWLVRLKLLMSLVLIFKLLAGGSLTTENTVKILEVLSGFEVSTEVKENAMSERL